MPSGPEPPCTIADILSFKRQQRFDLMAIVKEILNERRTGDGCPVVDVRLMDGSTQRNNSGETIASLPLTLFFPSDSKVIAFKKHVATTPLVFMCLQGYTEQGGKVCVKTVKDLFSWQPGVGTKCESMEE